ncbi:ABC transporter permease subunit [Streptomyces gobiensis]|uniref:branched-chain amino acid ABC transporter ATP-binding protein/permease n=1 Tax=Streptomyces gobiensis TaxID=2875706 RepID=UPI001E56053F|nr:branched-chain amino acid ABC transporter ATP-binding protein/permease [Streptomyces gobiensis]UGY94125.1 branched-chain amino acid ABC transporter ATP-binding protein/permease [Streptomyces gobiensis]
MSDRALRPLRALFLLAALAPVAALPLLTDDPYVIHLATVVGIYTIVAMGLNVLFGYTGQVSLGHGALVAVGAYTTAVLTVEHGWTFWTAAPLATAAATLMGGLMALPALRLSSWHLALVTIAFAMVVNGLLTELQGLTGGFAGILGIPRPERGGAEFTDGELYWLVVALAVLLTVLTRNLLRSRTGRALTGVRDAPDAARAAGAAVVQLKIFAFCLSAALAGLGGALLAASRGIVTPDDFPIDFSLFFLLVVIIGGAGRLSGPVIGTLAFFVIPELLGGLAQWRVLIYAVALLVLIIYAPHGIAGAWARHWPTLYARLPPGPWRRTPPAAAATRPRPLASHPDGGLELRTRDLQRSFGGIHALRGIQLTAAPGTIHAVVGPNGSGKTTLLNTMTGLVRPDHGHVLLNGTEITRRATEHIARHGVGRTFQTPQLLPGLSAVENVLLGAYARERASGIEHALALPRARRESRALREEALGYLAFVGLADYADVPAGVLPHGRQRLLEIARALMAHPRLLLMDEPAAGLSHIELEALDQLLREIRTRDITVVLVEHHIELVTNVADRVTVLDAGAVLVSAEPTTALRDDRVLDAYLGRSCETPLRSCD